MGVAEGCGKRKGVVTQLGLYEEVSFTHVTCDAGILLIVLLGTWYSIRMQSYITT